MRIRRRLGGPWDNYDRSCYYNNISSCVWQSSLLPAGGRETGYDYSLRRDRQAKGEGSHNDTTTRKAAMVTTMQDRLQERLDKIRTSSDYIIGLTDSLRLKLLAFFSHGSRAGATTEGGTKTTRIAEAACNGTEYNSCDVSTTAASTDGSDTESTTADADRLPSPTSTTVDNDVDPDQPATWQLYSLHPDDASRWSRTSQTTCPTWRTTWRSSTRTT